MNNRTQAGRSMVEMLGVLAIIGVLSVGGLAGYSTAMQKYKTNKLRDQLINIMVGANSLFQGDLSQHFTVSEATASADVVDILRDGGVISDGDYINNRTIKSAYNGDNIVTYVHYHLSTGGTHAAAMHMEFLIYGADQNLCINLLSNPPWKGFDWGVNDKSDSRVAQGDLSGDNNENMRTAVSGCPANTGTVIITFFLN